MKRTSTLLALVCLLLFTTGCQQVNLSNNRNEEDLYDVASVSQTESEENFTSEQEADSEMLSMETLEKIPDFSSVDSNGNQITSAVFSEYKLTLVNLWGTWCSPCVEELPNLQMLYQKYYDVGLNVIGVTEDSEGNEEVIQQILETQGVTYTILYPDDQFYDDFVSLCFTFPTTLLVDSEGNILQIFQGNPGFDTLDEAVGNLISKDPKTCIS